MFSSTTMPEDMLALQRLSNVGDPGLFVFRIDPHSLQLGGIYIQSDITVHWAVKSIVGSNEA